MIRKDTHYICQCIFLTGAVLALGIAFGQIGLLIAGVILLGLWGVQCHLINKTPPLPPRDRSKETPESW